MRGQKCALLEAEREGKRCAEACAQLKASLEEAQLKASFQEAQLKARLEEAQGMCAALEKEVRY